MRKEDKTKCQRHFEKLVAKYILSKNFKNIMEEKNNLIKEILQLSQSAFDLDSEDSEKDDIIIGTIQLARMAASLPVPRRKGQWIKPWRRTRNARGSFAFLTRELLLKDVSSYRNYLRMDKDQFHNILSLIKEDIELQNTRMRDAIAPAEQLAVTLRFLATGETFKSLNYQTRLSSSSISRIVPRVCKSIWRRLKGEFLKFPNSALEWQAVAQEFSIKWQFPNCLGALDGKHINFRSPRKDGAFFHNYKGTNSIILMALVDANCRFLFVDIGCNGRTNDAGVFLQSSLKNVLEEENNLPKDSLIGKARTLPYVIVAGDAFPMQKHLMKPYPYHTNCEKKKMFNKRLSRARHVVEHAFGILSNRFRVFLSAMQLKVETVEIITFACCALHNYLMENDANYINSVEYTATVVNPSSGVHNPRKGQAEEIRQEFLAYFNEEGKLDWM